MKLMVSDSPKTLKKFNSIHSILWTLMPKDNVKVINSSLTPYSTPCPLSPFECLFLLLFPLNFPRKILIKQVNRDQINIIHKWYHVF